MNRRIDSLQVVPATDSWVLVRQTGLSVWLVVAGNVTALLLFLAYDMTFEQLLLVFWLECLWIGIFGGARLLLATLLGDPYENRYLEVSKGSGLFFTAIALWATAGLFFGMLSAVGFLLLLPILEQGDGAVVLFENAELCFLVSVVLAFGHATSFVVEFVWLRGYKLARITDLLGAPFRASSSLVVAGACAAVLMILLPELVNQPGYAVLLIAVKLFIDLRIERSESKRSAPPGEAAGTA